MKRLDNFDIRFFSILEEKRTQPFEWGSNDCVLFAADVVLGITGEDLAESFRGRYKTERGSKTVMRNEGWDSLGEIVDSFLPSISQPRRGDVVLVEHEKYSFLGICIGKECVGPGRKGIVRTRRDFVTKSWRVG